MPLSDKMAFMWDTNRSEWQPSPPRENLSRCGENFEQCVEWEGPSDKTQNLRSTCLS